ncbi:hypothetical protein DEU56DRAFT_856873 [Suillus clintonianus]|uniref:uncharacterized protein n=1 Tax=Suillus clintonianus TaxID=1904413 RepID=UPI001B86F150|nr:uncharacterized protein DEU56DRAFT_856873 [Suillus clintonianus]KAG2139000.1 hypothetical protein DEU56DRAFT_856873 [Suillus clintonianus]
MNLASPTTSQSSMTPEAFVLLNIPDVTLTASGNSQSGVLALECVTAQAGGVHHAEVYLVIRLNSYECPIDPTQPVYFAFDPQLGSRSYTLSSPDGSTLRLDLPLTSVPHLLEDQDTFHGILAQYAEMRDSATGSQDSKSAAQVPVALSEGLVSGDHEAMRGRLVLIDEGNGEIVGELDNKVNINEDPSLRAQGRENDPVVIELPEDDIHVALARAIPPEDQDWIIKSASLASYVITGTTKLLLTTMTHASSYYINHSTPHPSVAPSSSGSAASSLPPPPPPRALVFLTSENARKGLSAVHTMSAQAATLSTKTVSLVDSMVKRAMGTKKTQQSQSVHNGSPSLSPRSTSPQPPPYSRGSALPLPRQSSSTYLTPESSTLPLQSRSSSPSLFPSPYPSKNKPPLPPRQSRSPSPQPGSAPPSSPRPPLKLHHRLLLSADLILSSLDSSMKQFVDVGGQNLGRAVEHKYGAEAARSAGLITGVTKNIVAVYIDMRGIGRRAIVKRAGKEFVRARMGHNNQAPLGSDKCSSA